MMMLRPWMVASVFVFAFHMRAFGQAQFFGSGAYMAQPACSTEVEIGDEASDIRDELQQRAQELKEAQSDLRRTKSQLSSAKASMNSSRDLFKLTGFEGSAFNMIEEHINSGAQCSDYKDSCDYCGAGMVSNPVKHPLWYFAEVMNSRLAVDIANQEEPVQTEFVPVFATPEYERAEAIAAAEEAKNKKIAQSNAKKSRLPAADAPPASGEETGDQPDKGADIGLPEPVTTRPVTVRQPTRPQLTCISGEKDIRGGFSSRAFLPHVGRERGGLNSSICSVEGVDGVPRGRNYDSCAKYLEAWIEKKRDLADLETEKLRLEAVVKELQALNKISKVELREALKDFQREQRENATEGGCVGCALSGAAVYTPKRSTIWDTIGNFALAAGSIYGGMQTSKYISDNNAKLGKDTNPMGVVGATATYGWPYIQAGLSGATIGGAGRGGFACSGSAFNGQGSNGPMGFGGPTGMMSPFGPMGGQQGMFGNPLGQFGSPMGNGMFNGGVGLGFQPGYGQQNYCPTWPCPVNGMAGIGGLPGLPGYLNPGFSAGGGFPGAGGIGGLGGLNGLGGFPGGGFDPLSMGGLYNPMGAGMGNMLGQNPMANYQMQQMQQQMYQQQMQLQAQQQARQYQNQMAQQQVMTGLYSELNNLVTRINTTQQQLATGGYTGFDSSYMPTSYNSGGLGLNSGFNSGGFPGTGGIVPGQYYNNSSSFPGTTTLPGLNGVGSQVPSYR